MTTATTDSLLISDSEVGPKAGILRNIMETMGRFQELVSEQKLLLTQAQVALLTDLSRQRISQLVADGTFSLVHLRAEGGEVVGTYVNTPDVVAWLNANRPSGAPGHRRKVSTFQFLKAAADDS